MRKYLFLLVLLCGNVLNLSATNIVEIVPVPDSVLPKPQEFELACKAAIKALRAGQGRVVSPSIVASALKAVDSDRPLAIREEIIVTFRIEPGSNKWVMASMSRAFQRTSTKDGAWQPLVSAQGMDWSLELSHNPTFVDIEAFVKRTNFGLNEFHPRTRVAKIFLYSPYASLAKTLEQPLALLEKRARYDDYISRFADRTR